ncbi:hypothetical protein [Rhizobium leguminosarum]|uniref:hypothetical protein n=1 Tax=Rhizobium leguminosarum TaxID=384 RepID=UPI0015597358|nr:hypothetical protein [Rhizobium leguminosarum]
MSIEILRALVPGSEKLSFGDGVETFGPSIEARHQPLAPKAKEHACLQTELS